MYLDQKFWSKIFGERIAIAKFGLSDSLSAITLLFDLSLSSDRNFAQRKAGPKAKSKVKVTHLKCVFQTNVFQTNVCEDMVLCL